MFSLQTPDELRTHPGFAPENRGIRSEHQGHRQAPGRHAQRCCRDPGRRQRSKLAPRSRRRGAATIREIYIQDDRTTHFPQTNPRSQASQIDGRASASSDYEWHGNSTSGSAGQREHTVRAIGDRGSTSNAPTIARLDGIIQQPAVRAVAESWNHTARCTSGYTAHDRGRTRPNEHA